MAFNESLDLAMMLAAMAFILVGYPIAFSLGGIALLFAFLGAASGVLPLAFLQALPQRVFGLVTDDILIALPMFIFMGVVLERAKIAEDLLSTAGRLMGSRPGGLAYAVTVVGALLAASTGVVGATTVTMGLISLPAMLAAGYDRRIATGTIAASATLAQIIPPATVLVLLGDQISNAWQSAQLAQGNFAPETVSVGDLFAGALVPGLALAVAYVLFLMAVAALAPQRMPPVSTADAAPVRWRDLGTVLFAPVGLVVVVLGSILGGIATPTEAAAVGAMGALLLAARRTAPARARLYDATVLAVLALLLLDAVIDLRIGRQAPAALEQAGIVAAGVLVAIIACGLLAAMVETFRAGTLKPIVESTTAITAMIFTILIGATLFSLIFRGLGGEEMIGHALNGLPGGRDAALLAVMAVIFLLGFVLDFIEIVFVVVPVVGPVLLQMPNVDPVWLGILIALNLQTSFLTPPFGPTLFYLRSVAPPEVSTGDIYRGIIPFVAIQLGVIALIWFFPALVTTLPRLIYG